MQTHGPAPGKLNTAAYYWSLFSLGMTVAAIGPALPQFAANTGASLGAVGLLLSAYRGGYMAGSLVGGPVLDRLNANRLLALGLVVITIAVAFAPVLNALPLLIAIYVLVGGAAGVVDVGGNTLLVWIHGRRVGPWINGLHFSLGVGAMLSPVLVGQSLRMTGGIQFAFFAMALLVIPGVVMLAAARSPQPPARETTEESAGNARIVVMVALLLFFYMGLETSFGGWISAWMVSVHKFSAARAATLASLFWGSLTAGRLLAIPLAARVRPGTLLAWASAGTALSLGLIASPAGPASEPVVWVATAGAGLFMAPVVATSIAFAGRHMRVTGSITRWFFAGAGAGGMAIPLAMGWLLEAAGPLAVMPANLVVSLLMGTLLAVLLVRVRAR